MFNYPKLCCKMILLVKNFAPSAWFFLMLLLNTITYRFKHDCTTTVVVAYFTHHLCMLNFFNDELKETFFLHMNSSFRLSYLIPLLASVRLYGWVQAERIFLPLYDAHKSISRSAEEKNFPWTSRSIVLYYFFLPLVWFYLEI